MKTLFDLNEVDSSLGEEMFSMVECLFPICRSITGDGVRQTLEIVHEHIGLDISETPTGTKVFDWEIPKEWNVKDAHISNLQGDRIVDFQQNNLHVLNYSTPVHEKISFESLKQHLYTLPDRPDWIPYRTSYYAEKWGFCLSQNQLDQMLDAEYEVHVDSSLTTGSLTYGECLIPGQSSEEVLISTHICHPSIANDNLSGIVIATQLAKLLQQQTNQYTYRILFVPGTIGAIAWLANNEQKLSAIKYGLVLSCLGDSGGPRYKKSRHATSKIDEIAQYILEQNFKQPVIEEFYPYGYDERQYCSPGIDLPVGLIARSKYGEYPEYHTSADNLDFVSSKELAVSYEMIKSIIAMVENNRTYVNLFPKGEPQLGKRGLYEAIGGGNESQKRQLAMLWILNQADGSHDLLNIALKSGVSFDLLVEMSVPLLKSGLIVEAD